MLLAIDVGNTHLVVGVHREGAWKLWRRGTDAGETEDELAVWLKTLFDLEGLPFQVDGIIVGSVVPAINENLRRLGLEWFGVEPVFLTHGAQVGLEVRYDPPHAVGADRIANALGALARVRPPLVVVDFGTATTFDVVSEDGAYVGGAILPGLHVSGQALFGRTAKLPQIEYRAPERAIGRSTVESLQSGLMLGYAGAIDELAEQIVEELGGKATVIATGGLGRTFVGLCRQLQGYEEFLTLEGLEIAYRRITGAL